jgi:hypothetical protein
VALRGRADVRVRDAGGYGAHFTMLGGVPTATARGELLLSALVSTLRHPDVPGPARVLGWWPDCGKAWIVPVDGAALDVVADAVLAAVDIERRR